MRFVALAAVACLTACGSSESPTRHSSNPSDHDQGGDNDGGDSSGGGVLADNLVVLSASNLASLTSTSDDLDTLTFTNADATIKGLTEGALIAASTTGELLPHGMLRHVDYVETSGNTTTLETSQATLSEAINTGTVHNAQTLSGADVTLLTPTKKGVTRAAGGITLDHVELTSGVFVDGSVDFSMALDLSIDIDGFSVASARFVHTTAYNANLTLSTMAAAEFSERYKIASATFVPIIIYVAALPIVIEPVLDVYVGLDGSVSSAFSMNASQNTTMTMGVEYDGEWQPVRTWDASFGFEAPTEPATSSATAWVGPELSLLLYGIAGPYAGVRGYVELDAETLPAGSQWEIYAGMKVVLGLKVEVLGTEIVRYEPPALIDLRKQLAAHAAGTAPRWQTSTIDTADGNAFGFCFVGAVTDAGGAVHTDFIDYAKSEWDSVVSRNFVLFDAQVAEDLWAPAPVATPRLLGVNNATGMLLECPNNSVVVGPNGLTFVGIDDTSNTVPDYLAPGFGVMEANAGHWTVDLIEDSVPTDSTPYKGLSTVAAGSDGTSLYVAASYCLSNCDTQALYLFTRTTSGWSAPLLVDTANNIDGLVMTVAPDGRPHVVYGRSACEPNCTDTVTHMVISGITPTLDTVYTFPAGYLWGFGENTVAVAEEGTVYVVTSDADDELVLYKGSTGSYIRTLIDHTATRPAVLLDGTTLHVAYYGLGTDPATETGLHYGVSTDTGFQTELVENNVRGQSSVGGTRVQLAQTGGELTLVYVRLRGDGLATQAELRAAHLTAP